VCFSLFFKCVQSSVFDTQTEMGEHGFQRARSRGIERDKKLKERICQGQNAYIMTRRISINLLQDRTLYLYKALIFPTYKAPDH
jgi:hypothetical protein